MISQDYFDEVCKENLELFSSSREEAVEEAIQQLGGRAALTGLVLNFPNDNDNDDGDGDDDVGNGDGCCCPVRRVQSEFKHALQQFITVQENDAGSEERNNIIMKGVLTTLRALFEKQPIVCAHILLLEKGMEIMVDKLLSIQDVNDHLTRSITATMTCFLRYRSNSNNLYKHWQDCFQQKTAFVSWSTIRVMQQLEALRETSEKDCPATNNHDWNCSFFCDLLHLACTSCKANQVNKQIWMNEKSVPHLLLDTLSMACTRDDDWELVQSTCRFMTILCSHDDAAAANNTPEIPTSHAHAQRMVHAGALPVLANALKQQEQQQQLLLVPQSGSVRRACSSSFLQTIRSLAVHNDTVQQMVSLGILKTATKLFQIVVVVDDDDNDAAEDASCCTLATACLGFFRNICANDDIKCALCRGGQSIVAGMLRAMHSFPFQQLLQEHACGCIAAMALRQPENANYLLHQMHDVVPAIVQAMRQFPRSVSVQRQGALAIRNLASRAHPHDRKDLLDATGNVLETIAAQHLQCQDEVYAALRDMGVQQARVVHLVEKDGKMVVKENAFGKGLNANFRPVYD